MDAAGTSRAALDRLDLGQQGLLGEVPFVDLADLLVRADDLVDEDREREEDRGEDDDEARRDVGQDRVLGPLLHVAEGPVRAGQPEDDQVDDDRLERELDDGAAEEPGQSLADLAEDLVHAAGCLPLLVDQGTDDGGPHPRHDGGPASGAV